MCWFPRLTRTREWNFQHYFYMYTDSSFSSERAFQLAVGNGWSTGLEAIRKYFVAVRKCNAKCGLSDQPTITQRRCAATGKCSEVLFHWSRVVVVLFIWLCFECLFGCVRAWWCLVRVVKVIKLFINMYVLVCLLQGSIHLVNILHVFTSTNERE